MLKEIFQDQIPKYLLKYEKYILGSEFYYKIYKYSDFIPEFILKRNIIDVISITEAEFLNLDLHGIIANNPARQNTVNGENYFYPYLEQKPWNITDISSNLIQSNIPNSKTLEDKKNLLKQLNCPLESIVVKRLKDL